MPRTLDTDEHGVVFDEDLPHFVQSDADLRRWELSLGVVRKMLGKPADALDRDVELFASWIFASGIPTDEEGALSEQLYLAEAGPPRRQWRNRMGRWIDMPDISDDMLPSPPVGPDPADLERRQSKRVAPDKPRKLKKFVPPPSSPGTDENLVAKIVMSELIDWPEPSDFALSLMQGEQRTADRFRLKVQPPASPGFDPDRHPVYLAHRARRHRRIIGQTMAPTFAALLGPNHPITRKAQEGFVGGYLTELEKTVVRTAAHEARNGEDPEALFMAGGAASGKSTVLNQNPDLRPSNAIHIDPDKIKEGDEKRGIKGLPEYTKLVEQKDPYAASAVHQESGDIAARMYDESVSMGLSVIMDGVGNSPPGWYREELVRAHESGYEVEVMYVNRDTADAAMAVLRRMLENGRLVPIPFVWEQHAMVSRNFRDEISKLPWARINVFDFNAGHLAFLHGESGVERVFEGKEEAYGRFIDKADQKPPPDFGVGGLG